jgi:hypothetical protein
MRRRQLVGIAPWIAAAAIVAAAAGSAAPEPRRFAPFDRKLWFGYFFAFSDRYPPDSPDLPQNVTVVTEPAAIARAARRLPVIVGATGAELDAAAEVWRHVAAVYVSEESSAEALALAAQGARRKIERRGLEPRPIVVYATESQRDADGWRMPPSADYLAPELYVDPALQDDPGAARRAVLDSVAAWARRTPRDVPWLIVGQAYDRNGEWRNRETLIALQDVYAEILRRERRAKGLLLFAANRPGGVRDHPDLVARHERIFEAIRRAR